ncbi:MAG TPA: site-specific integrase [Geminicoccaceae bacterium]|nr:site-specific integrase [Geminicoccus sp.]HMU53014.1 site-specific integrase [Geminicoccaceae bacterium]
MAASPPGLNQMADVLITIARMWVQADKAALDGLRLLARRIDCRSRGLTQSNRERLRQFDDPRNVARLLTLPEHLRDLARKQPVTQPAALQMQTALAIAILLAAPIRLRNLAGLRLGEHIVRTGRGASQMVRLVIEGDQTKNHEPLDHPLPVETARLLDLYLASYRPLLLRGADDGALFPGGGAKSKNLLGQQIQKVIRSHTGLVVHTHLFRHLAGKLSLQVDPGNFEQVRRLLGHRSIDTTTLFYTGFATDAAARRYHEQVLRPEPAATGTSRS